MSFLPQNFLANIKAKEGLAKPSRFQVILPIPKYIGDFIGNSTLESLLNFPNTVLSDVTAQFLGSNSTSAANSARTDISRYLALQCESAELPGKTLMTQDVEIYGPSFKVPYRAAYTETSFTFLCTNEFYERKLFDRWLEAIVPTDTNNIRFPKSQGSRFMCDIQIIQYDDFIKQIYGVNLIDAFPIAISQQALNWGEDGFHRLTVQFTYQKYKTIYDSRYDLGEAATSVLGGLGTRLLGI